MYPTEACRDACPTDSVMHVVKEAMSLAADGGMSWHMTSQIPYMIVEGIPFVLGV